MSLQELRTVLSLPIEPARRREQEWARVHQQLCTELPDDYKELISAYGGGCVGGFIWVGDPFAQNRNVNLIDQARRHGEIFRAIREKHPAEVSFSLFPEPGGFLPWGTSDNGDVIGWLTDGVPGEWPTMVAAARDRRTFAFDGSMTTFLARLVTRELVCPIFPADFPPAHPGYVAE